MSSKKESEESRDRKLSSSRVFLCFKQSSPEKVDELYSRIIKAGFEGVRMPWKAFWGQYYSSVLDPDGNQVDIFSAL